MNYSSRALIWWLAFAAGVLAWQFAPAVAAETKLAEPAAGFYYLGVFPGGVDGAGSDVTLKDVVAFQRAVGKHPTWVYFNHNWYEGTAFPLRTAAWIRSAGSVPYIRLMMLSGAGPPGPDPQYTLKNIVDGRFDRELTDWMRAARRFGSPMIVEYGTEVNGWWFPWNGLHNSGNISREAAVAQFREAYRHIVRISRAEAASNIRWVFHVDPWDEPAEPWNQFENYYPGDAWVDWVGVSVYGKQRPRDPYTPSFRYQMDWAYGRLRKVTEKAVLVCEFGTIRNQQQAPWTEAALQDLLGGRWPKVIGFSWWNADFENDPETHRRSNMRVQDSPALRDVFRRYVADSPRVIGVPLACTATPRDERPQAASR